MQKNEEFSVAIITRNEGNVLPRLLESLKGVNDIVVLDTGSTDNTVKIAKEYGCNVVEVGEMFKIKATEKQVYQWKAKYGYDPSFKAGQGYFHFSKARNYASSLTKNDWVFQPDADEVVEWDFEKVQEIIQNEDHLVYQFCYQYEPNGVCGLEFAHSKFFRKSKMEWTKWVHEIHTPVKGQNPKPAKFVDFIYHKHYQEHKLERGNYLPGLELSVLENPKDDRNVYYLAREYFYRGMYKEAISMFESAVELNHWAPERGQAYIYKAQSHWALGEKDTAIELLHKSIAVHNERREPFWELGNYYRELEQWDKAITYHLAATGVPFHPQGYLNSKELYSWKIEDSLAFMYGKIGNTEESKVHWLKALKYNPPKSVLAGYKWFYKEQPLISIVVPTVRDKGYKRLIESIKKNTVYENYEIVRMGEDNGTAIKKFNDGVKKAKGDLIVYIADDCTVEQGWLVQAFACLQEKLNGRGMVIFNDNHWKGALANHFLINKNVRDELDGEIWHSGYGHCGVDVELLHRLRAKNLSIFCEEARINHLHYFAPSRGAIPDKPDKYSKRVNDTMKADRTLLSQRLWQLGLTEAARENDRFFQSMYGHLAIPDRIDLENIFISNKIDYSTAKVLNVGIGSCESGLATQLMNLTFKKITHVEIYEPYIEHAKTLKWNTADQEYISVDIRDIENFDDYDLILLFDVLEHLPKDDSIKLLKRLIKEQKRIVVFGPLEEVAHDHRTGTDDIESQNHLSCWVKADFDDLGFKTTLLKNFHQYPEYTCDAIWAVK